MKNQAKVIVKPSVLDATRLGVFATSSIKKGDIFHVDVGIPVPNNILHNTVLEGYVIPAQWDHESIVVFGQSSFLDDGEDDANMYINTHQSDDSWHINVFMIASRNIKKDEEILLNYERIYGEEKEA